MAKSISGTRKSKPRGRPKTGSVSIHIRMPPREVAVLDEWIGEQKITRPEAVRALMLKGARR